MSFSEYFRDRWEDFAEYMLIEHDIDVSLVSLYIFMIDSSSSKWAYRWNLFLMVWVFLHITMIILESCDGPNHYKNRPEVAQFPFLLTEEVCFSLIFSLLYCILI
jgi:hypothetical protein